MRREVPVEAAIGMPLAHDLTRIVPGSFKGRAFAKGHIIREEDIPLLLDMGKRHVYVLELDETEMHEDEAAQAMAEAIAGPGLTRTAPHEGKVVLKAVQAGMLWVDVHRVVAMNMIDDISITTRQPFAAVDAGMSVAGIRPIPLVIERDKVEAVKSIAEEAVEGNAIIDVLPYQPQQVHIVTTGSEIQSGRIQDRAGPVLREKFAAFGIEVADQVLVGDDQAMIASAIVDACAKGATLVCVTGGMSVDPDDRSPAAIRQSSTNVVTYGTPMLPGSMLMLAYRQKTAIFGLPGAIIHDPRTSFDVLLPRVLAGIAITKQDIAMLGPGGWLHA